MKSSYYNNRIIGGNEDLYRSNNILDYVINFFLNGRFNFIDKWLLFKS